MVAVVGLSHSVFAAANQTFKSSEEVVADYVNRLNKGFEPFFSIKHDSVAAEKNDVNRDGSNDLVLNDKDRCGSAAECEIDVYLCTNDETDCKGGNYCFADNLYKDQLKKKGRTLVCQ